MSETCKYLEEHQKFVKEEMDNAFKNPTEIPEGVKSDPINIAFDENDDFTDDNWNDRRISLFRHFFSGWFHDGISFEIVFIGDLEISHQWDEDQNYVFIRNTRTNDLYYATWYKSRGRTDLILHNGKKISLSSFKNLLLEMLESIKSLDVEQIERKIE